MLSTDKIYHMKKKQKVMIREDDCHPTNAKEIEYYI